MLAFLMAAIAALPGLAVAEYLAHRLVMHHETPLAGPSYDRHAVQHHRLGRVDVNVDTPAWWCCLLSSPAAALAWWAGGWPAALGVALAAACYGRLWTGWHRAIHGLGGGWSTRLPGYEAIRRHHLEHHRRPGRNFGTAFGPLLDRPFGTHSRPGGWPPPPMTAHEAMDRGRSQVLWFFALAVAGRGLVAWLSGGS